MQSWHEDGHENVQTTSDGDDSMMIGDSADVVAQVEDDGVMESGMMESLQ